MSAIITQGKPSDATGQLKAIEQELAALQARLRRESLITKLLAGIILLALGGYFFYGYRQISHLLQPDQIVALASSLVDENLTPAREALQQEISGSAPAWAEHVSGQLVSAAPRLRERLEAVIVDRSRAAVEEAVQVSQEQFRAALREHRDTFQQLITELASGREASDELLKAVETALNDEFGGDMQTTAGDVLQSLHEVNARLARLSSGQNLTADEQLERHTLMLFRRIQMEEDAARMTTN